MSQVTDKAALLNLSVTKKEEIIRREFSKEELAEMKDTVATNLMQLNDYEEELQEIKDDFKGKMNPLKKENKHLLTNIRQKYEDVKLLVHLVPDYDNKIMELYDEEGNKVGERRMMMSELQGKLDL